MTIKLIVDKDKEALPIGMASTVSCTAFY